MRRSCVILVFLYALLQASALVLGQSCPAIKYTQRIVQLPQTQIAGAGAPAYSISFVNNSPYLPLEFLDVHYRIQDGMVRNFRLLSSDEHSGLSSLHQIHPFLMQPGDHIVYNFTYRVAGLDFACNTPSFIVQADSLTSVSEPAHSSPSPASAESTPVSATSEPEAAPAIPVSRMTAPNRVGVEGQLPSAREAHMITPEDSASVGVSETETIRAPVQPSPRQTLAPLSPARPRVPISTPSNVANPSSGRQMHRETAAERTPAPARPRARARAHARPSGPVIQSLDSAENLYYEDPGQMPVETTGACPLINFNQKIVRARGDNNYMISFHNLSPSTDLTFLDVHYKINDFPLRNVRIFSDPEFKDQANEGAISGLHLTPDDILQYSFTYGVEDRACDTESFTVRARDVRE